MTDERLLVGFLVLIGVGVSFALTVVAFGAVVLVAVALGVTGLVLGAATRSHHAGSGALMIAGTVALTGPLVYIALAIASS